MKNNLIYLDFEGFEAKDPSLVGYLYKGKFKQIILDDDFKVIADETDIEFSEFKGFCNFITELSNKEDSIIASYSSHEQQIIEDVTKEELPFVDIRKLIKKNVNKHHSSEHKKMKEYSMGQKHKKNGSINPHHNPRKRKRWALLTMLKLFNYPELNTSYGYQKVTVRLKAVKDGLKARGTYKELTRIQKTKWTNLLKHNTVDVKGLEYLVDLQNLHKILDC